MSRDTVANPPPPYVTFGDILMNPPLPPKVSRIIWMAPNAILQLIWSVITVEATFCDHFGTNGNWSHYPNDNTIQTRSIPT